MKRADFQGYVLLKTIYEKVGYRGLYIALERTTSNSDES